MPDDVFSTDDLGALGRYVADRPTNARAVLFAGDEPIVGPPADFVRRLADVDDAVRRRNGANRRSVG